MPAEPKTPERERWLEAVQHEIDRAMAHELKIRTSEREDRIQRLGAALTTTGWMNGAQKMW